MPCKNHFAGSASRGSGYSKLSSIIKIRRHIMFSVVAIFNCMSVMFILRQSTLLTSHTALDHSKSLRLVALGQRSHVEKSRSLGEIDRYWTRHNEQRHLSVNASENDEFVQQRVLASRGLYFNKLFLKNKKQHLSVGNRIDLGAAILFQGQKENKHGVDMMRAVSEVAEAAAVDPRRISFVNRVINEVNEIKAVHYAYYRKPIKPLPEQNKGVIIVTNYRPGSTFLGELFNQHPDAFYTFEPLFIFYKKDGMPAPAADELLKIEILHKILKCDFPEMEDVYKKVISPATSNFRIEECLKNNICFRKMSKLLCEGDLCTFDSSTSCQYCGPLHLPRVNNVCRAKKISVIKTIRVDDINQIKTIANDPTLDVKIIHLIRDPRGIESSRMKIHKNWRLNKDSEVTCKKLLKNGLSGEANTRDTEWMKDRYMKIRYEDLALQPLSYAEKIYRFVGLEFVNKVKLWIMQNTHADGDASLNKFALSTKRNSETTIKDWRKHLTFEQVSRVQSKCMRTLSFFGYKPVNSEKELKNFEVQVI